MACGLRHLSHPPAAQRAPQMCGRSRFFSSQRVPALVPPALGVMSAGEAGLFDEAIRMYIGALTLNPSLAETHAQVRPAPCALRPAPYALLNPHP